jgi:hypothetical protein
VQEPIAPTRQAAMNRTADELTLYEWDKCQYPARIVVRGSFASSFSTVFAYRNS